jgi:hypothetical protein
VEQEELNTDPTTPYQICVSIHGGRNCNSFVCIGAVLSEKQSFSHVLDSCSDNSTKHEVEQEELNTDPEIPYSTCVSVHDGCNCKKLPSHSSRPERETVV